MFMTADSLSVPLIALRGSGKKAAKLLKTEGAVVPALGVGDNVNFVLSYSGRKPHLVVPKKGGLFACDKTVPLHACPIAPCHILYPLWYPKLPCLSQA